MDIKSTLTHAVKTAMKARQMEEVKVLRNVQAAIKQIEIDKQTTLDDEAILVLLQKQVKQRQESLTIFVANGREDLAQKERFEMDLIAQFLPEQLDEAALSAIIQAQIEALSASSMKDMGKVVAAVKAQTAGQADPAVISALVKKALA